MGRLLRPIALCEKEPSLGRGSICRSKKKRWGGSVGVWLARLGVVLELYRGGFSAHMSERPCLADELLCCG